jgi:RNA polymerase sigma factor (sigma-70 family)
MSFIGMEDAKEKEFLEDIVANQGIIIKICRIYRSANADREDLSQEIIYNAWRSYPNFKGKSKFSTWLYRVAINTALHQNRKKKAYRESEKTGMLNHEMGEEKNEQIDLLYRAIGQLKEMEKSILLLYLEEISYKEMAEITGLTETNIGVKLTRIKIRLKNILSEYGI